MAGEETRKLAALMAVDIVGYSRMMSVNERHTFTRLKVYEAELLKPNDKIFGGNSLLARAAIFSAVRQRDVVGAAQRASLSVCGGVSYPSTYTGH